MRTLDIRSLLLLALLASGASAQSEWTKQAPLPTWKSCQSIAAPADDEFFATAAGGAAQDGDVLHNVGGGYLDWEVIPLGVSTANAIFFLDTQRGWAAGNGMFHTTDGGQTWVQDNNWGSMYDLFFLDAQRGWATGNGGIVYRTTDGGLNWTGVSAGLFGHTCRSVWFVDAQHGWAAGIGGHLSESLDGGATWTTRYTGSYMTTVQFFDALEGWGIGGDTFVHTADGGATWQPAALPAGTWAHSGRFYDRQRGIAVGQGGNAVYTLDGGVTWQTSRPDGSGPLLWDVEFSPGGVALASGDRGELLRSDDFGATWQSLRSGAPWTVRGLDAVDGARAWAANDEGQIGLTVDGGLLWERVAVQGFDANGDLQDVDFVDANVGWTVGQQQVFVSADEGRIARSDDGGRTWQLQFQQAGLQFFGVAALDVNTAIAYGLGGSGTSAYLRTTDGGQTWSAAGSPTPLGGFEDACFLPDGLTGWIVGEDVWHTTDGGLTWGMQYDGNIGLTSVSFADASHGWASGYANTLLRTTDGGQTWTQVDPGGPAGAAYVTVTAASPGEALVAGWKGFVARTTDGGQTWTIEAQDDLQYDVAFTEWNASFLLDGETGWIGGNGGIYRRGDALGPVGDPFCFGDGTGIVCPCGNFAGAGEGCLHSGGVGALLHATGAPSVANDTIVLHLEQGPANVVSLAFGGTAQVAGGVGSLFGDGLRCAGGQVTRLQVVPLDAAGAGATTVGVSAADGSQAGETRYYQSWVRDPVSSPCGTGFNLSNGLALTWGS